MYWIPQRTKAYMLVNLNSEPLTWVYLHQSRGEDIDYTLLDCNSLMLYQIVSSDVLVLIAKCSPIKVLTFKIFIKRCGIHLLAKMYNNFESVFMINTFINHRHLNIGFCQKRAQHRKALVVSWQTCLTIIRWVLSSFVLHWKAPVVPHHQYLSIRF